MLNIAHLKFSETVQIVEIIKDLQGDADLENQEELVEFFMKVMNRRKEKNWNYAMMRERCESSTVRAKL